jgi:hypothetical protein
LWDKDKRVWTAAVAVAIPAKKDKRGETLVSAVLETFYLQLPADREGKVITENIDVTEPFTIEAPPDDDEWYDDDGL